MTEQDWKLVVRLFIAARSGRDDLGRSDRRRAHRVSLALRPSPPNCTTSAGSMSILDHSQPGLPMKKSRYGTTAGGVAPLRYPPTTHWTAASRAPSFGSTSLSA